ncbi:MAG: hypothetical protein K6G80_08575, partial [Treponema sp.]|nr:hypothetical protein [Treponema sp.]
MKKIIFLSAVIVGFFGAASCSHESSKNVLRMNVSSEPDSFFPWESAAADTAAIYYNIFDGLLSFDEKGQLHPALAESYTISEDKLTYTFRLRKNVKFHNGADFTSADCLYTYENLAGLNGNSVKSDTFGRNVESLEAPDAYTFTVRTKTPMGGFLALNIHPILPVGYHDHALHPVGTGAYRFVEYKLHQQVVLERNDDYWNRAHMPKIPRIEIYVMSDENAILSALQANQLDIGQMLSPDNAKALEGKFQLLSVPQNMVQILGFNNSVKPLDNELVRKALTLAVDKKEIIASALGGFGTPLYSNFSPVLGAYYNDELSDVLPYNVERAKELLAQAGYADGFTLEITVPGNYKTHVDTAQVIAKQLEKIGV